MWRFRGTPHYFDVQANRLGLSKDRLREAWGNAELHRVSGLLGQLCERYHRAPREDGRAVMIPSELAQIQATLGRCERELEKLHALAATAEAMLEEAHDAFGLECPRRRFRVRCDSDEPVAPVEA